MSGQECGLGCKWWGSIIKTFKGDDKVMHVFYKDHAGYNAQIALYSPGQQSI